MRDVQEIVQMVSLRGGSELKSVGEKVSDTLYDQLFEGIKNGTFTNDEQAATALYGDSTSSKARYKTLKSRLKDLLLDNVLLMRIDPRKQSPLNRLMHQAIKNFCTARILLLNGASLTGASMMKKALQLSESAQTTGLSVICLQYLALMSSVLNDRTNFKKYSTKMAETLKLYNAEIEAEHIENEVRLMVLRQVGFNKKVNDFYADSFKKLETIVQGNKSSNIQWNYFRVGFQYFEFAGEFKRLLQLAHEAEVYNKSKKEQYSEARRGETSLIQLSCYLQLKRYDQGSEHAENCKAYFIKGTYNWFVYSENHLMFELNTRNYERALEIYNEATRHPRMKTLPSDRQEKWRIYEAYLYYLLPPVLRPQNFKVMRFLNEVPLYSKDKAGYNVAINIIQILLLVQERHFDKLIDKAESLKMYRSRYIKEDENFRSNCFVKMLLIMIRCDFDPVATKREAEGYFKQMQKFKEKSGRHFDAMEVVPYEVLWESVLEDIQVYTPQSH